MPDEVSNIIKNIKKDTGSANKTGGASSKRYRLRSQKQNPISTAFLAFEMVVNDRTKHLDEEHISKEAHFLDPSFMPIYKEKILPRIQECDALRMKALKRFKFRAKVAWCLTPLLIISIVALIVYVPNRGHGHIQGAVAALSAEFLILGYWLSRPLKNYYTHIKNLVFPHVFQHINESFKYTAKKDDCIKHLHKFGLTPKHTTCETEDYISGVHSNVKFHLMEATLKKVKHRWRRSYIETVFKGFLIRLEMNKNFKGHTAVFNQGSNDPTPRFFGLWKKRLGTVPQQEVELEDPEFNKRFKVYADDQVEARYLLTPSFMERLKTLGHNLKAQHLECSFIDNEVLIKVSTNHNYFEPENIYNPPLFIEAINTIFSEIHVIYDIIEHLKLHEKTRL